MTDDVRTSERTGGPAPAIVAVASPPGCGPRGIVRMSGPGCHQIVRAVDDRLEPVGAAHRVALARVRIPEGAVPALALLGDAPRTFTGEDTVELHLAGNPLLLDRLVDALLAAAEAIGVPARHATPGEFSARAFLNGRLALDRAEAIALAASAQRDDELRAARLLAEGCVGRAVAAWSDSALELLALVEAGIDFTDEDDVVAIAPVELATRATATADAIDRALAAALRPERLESAPTVVLVGPPNAGKSALFNALLGAERAVSTPIAGTTRDALSAPLCLDGPTGALTVTLVDVAGEETGRTASDGDELDRLARLAAHQATARADLLVRCVPPDAVAPPLPSAGPTSLTIRTKSDLLASRPAGDTGPRLAVSALTGAGIDELRRAIADELTGSGESIAGATMAVTARQDRLLRAASAALRDAAALGAGSTPRLASPELVAATLRLSLDRLGQISGRVVADDVLGAIFGRFCIGK